MSNNELLKNEINNAKKYILEEKDNVVLLTTDNVSRVLAMISYDSSYNKVFDTKAAGIIKKGIELTSLQENAIINKENVDDNNYYRNGMLGSSAYWFDNLNKSKTENEFKYYLFKTICAVDNENSTHLNGDNVGRIEIWERLCKLTHNSVEEFRKLLIDEDLNSEDGIVLLKKISKKTHPKSNKKGRRNISFASKFCHYACRNILSENYWDKFPITDTILKDVLPFYAKEHKIKYDSKKYNDEDIIISYMEFNKIINELSKETRISKTGIDQLLWYYYKGHELQKNNG